MRIALLHLLALILGVELSSCTALTDLRPTTPPPLQPEPQSLEVTATAYNSVPDQTDDTPFIAAWGDRLEPDMRVLAVSRDLLEMGLTRGARVRIEGIKGEFVVLDKMGKRWQKRIDLYMGLDVQAARRWGRKQVTITWTEPEAEAHLELSAIPRH